ncbi:hypothetical protein O181_014242 [Austropuccinia psidii MF-1]|uniref:Uncharacterized protein n=1 Tax=Austropuccinia psidii MF-1 TaxID=1389203 RepID=A0A9Q3C197_9BASI|nr:hypothetical protein [Austropuccinia psidii MF-1]
MYHSSSQSSGYGSLSHYAVTFTSAAVKVKKSGGEWFYLSPALLRIMHALALLRKACFDISKLDSGIIADVLVIADIGAGDTPVMVHTILGMAVILVMDIIKRSFKFNFPKQSIFHANVSSEKLSNSFLY